MNYSTMTLTTPAGHDITARLFGKHNSNPKAVCIIASATGVAQFLYTDFANWLAEQGYVAITFDYDGIGLSIDRHVKYSESDVLSWGTQDSQTIVNYVAHRYPQQKRIWIGHSVGGHMLGFMDDTSKIDAAITVASGTGTWWHNSIQTKRVAWFLWYFVVPITVPLFGYFPGDKLRMLCNLPKGTMQQWRKWCLRTEYAVGHEGDWLKQKFADVDLPITAISFSDDEMMSPLNINQLHKYFSNADVTKLMVKPQDVGLKRIGHIGWHKGKFKPLWESVLMPQIANAHG